MCHPQTDQVLAQRVPKLESLAFKHPCREMHLPCEHLTPVDRRLSESAGQGQDWGWRDTRWTGQCQWRWRRETAWDAWEGKAEAEAAGVTGRFNRVVPGAWTLLECFNGHGKRQNWSHVCGQEMGGVFSWKSKGAIVGGIYRPRRELLCFF